jgi:hypothetical protein
VPVTVAGGIPLPSDPERIDEAREKAAEEARARLDEAERVRAAVGEEEWGALRREATAGQLVVGAAGLCMLAAFWLALTSVARWVAERLPHRVAGAGGWSDRAPFFLLLDLGVLALLLAVTWLLDRRLAPRLDRLATPEMTREAIWAAVHAERKVRGLMAARVARAEDEADQEKFEKESAGARP